MTDFWKNTDINDLKGEEWKDIQCYALRNGLRQSCRGNGV